MKSFAKKRNVLKETPAYLTAFIVFCVAVFIFLSVLTAKKIDTRIHHDFKTVKVTSAEIDYLFYDGSRFSKLYIDVEDENGNKGRVYVPATMFFDRESFEKANENCDEMYITVDKDIELFKSGDIADIYELRSDGDVFLSLEDGLWHEAAQTVLLALLTLVSLAGTVLLIIGAAKDPD